MVGAERLDRVGTGGFDLRKQFSKIVKNIVVKMIKILS
jgi:hypothetical protein